MRIDLSFSFIMGGNEEALYLGLILTKKEKIKKGSRLTETCFQFRLYGERQRSSLNHLKSSYSSLAALEAN